MLEPLATTVLLNLLLLLIANPALISAKTPRVAQRFDGDTSSTLTMTGPALRRVRACAHACVRACGGRSSPFTFCVLSGLPTAIAEQCAKEKRVS
jgi:hypothetical protein